MTIQGLAFTSCEECGITLPMPTRATVSQRLRGHLKKLYKHGDGVRLRDFSKDRPGGAQIKPQELSAFLRPKPGTKGGRKGITLDDLDDLADFYNTSIAELLGDTRLRELSGPEQRVVYAFRTLEPVVQEHFLALLELTSVAVRQHVAARRTSGVLSTQDSPVGEPGSLEAPQDGRAISAGGDTRFEDIVNHCILLLTQLVAPRGTAGHHRSTPDTGAG